MTPFGKRVRIPSALTACLAGMLYAAWPAVADPVAPMTPAPEQLTRAIMDLARKNITGAKVSDGSFVPPETPAELAEPLMSLEEAKIVVGTGLDSGAAAWCGLDWQNGNFLPLMAWQRSRQIWADKQLAYIGLMHGLTMGTAERQLRKRFGTCSDAQRGRLEEHMRARWSK